MLYTDYSCAREIDSVLGACVIHLWYCVLFWPLQRRVVEVCQVVHNVGHCPGRGGVVAG